MAKKRVGTHWLKLVTAIFTIAVLSHTYYSLYGSPNHEFQGGISGKSITENIDNIKKSITFSEGIILAGEWLFIISLFMITLIKSKMEVMQVEEVIVTPKKTRLGISTTDIDSMYNLLKEKKSLKLKNLAAYFKVNDEIILEWAKILEEANLIIVYYPIIGEPILKIIEETINEK